MKPAEYLELIQQSSDGTVSHAMHALSIIFAYVVAIYFAGAELTSFQIFSITAIYTIFFFYFSLLSVLGNLVRFLALRREFASEHKEIASRYGIDQAKDRWMGFWPIPILVLFLGWLFSILFMISVG